MQLAAGATERVVCVHVQSCVMGAGWGAGGGAFFVCCVNACVCACAQRVRACVLRACACVHCVHACACVHCMRASVFACAADATVCELSETVQSASANVSALALIKWLSLFWALLIGTKAQVCRALYGLVPMLYLCCTARAMLHVVRTPHPRLVATLSSL
jgi:hypothetical protein